MKKQIDLSILTENCVRRYSLITTSRTEANSLPYLRGTDLSVCSILEGLYFKGSISGLAEHYPNITEEQVKETLLFASTFIELAYKSETQNS